MKQKKPKFLAIYAVIITALLAAAIFFTDHQLAQANAHSRALAAQVDNLSEELTLTEGMLREAQKELEQTQDELELRSGKENKTLVYVTPNGSKYHKKSCTYAQADGVLAITKSEAFHQGYTPCSLCQP